VLPFAIKTKILARGKMSRAPQLAIAIIVVAVSTTAQTRMGRFAPASRLGPRPISIARGHHRYYPGYGYYGSPFWYSDYYEPYDVDYAPPEPPAPAPVMQIKAEPTPDPELLELRAGQWVRVTNFTAAAAATTAPSQPSPAKPLPPAVLVFRDGHSEEISSYSIIGPAIYTKADYWSTGKWTRTIQLADVNIPATIEQNHARGINFGLPSSPDEIMIRP
jgi:hypothetical protein